MQGRDGKYLGDHQFDEFDQYDVKIPVELIDPKSAYASRLPSNRKQTTNQKQTTSTDRASSVSCSIDGNAVTIERQQPNACSSRQQRKSGKMRMWSRIRAKNTQHMHLGNRRMTEQQKKERAKAKKRDSAFREHPATYDEICSTVIDTVGIPDSQISPYVDGKITNKDGELFTSPDGLEIAADYVLSLSQDEDN